jgi:hypothetical protein
MPQEILSIATYVPLPGNEEASLATMRVLMKVLETRGFSRDLLYHDPKSGEYVLLRYWKSEEMRRSAAEDPEVQRCWVELSHEVKTIKIFEQLEGAFAGVPK